METEKTCMESDAELGTDTDTEKGGGVQSQPAKEVEVEFSMPLAAVLKSIFQNGGGAAVREVVNGMLSRRGKPEAPAGEQTALRAAMDELENDPSDEAGKILNIIFGCFDAVELAREKKYPIEKPTSGESVADTIASIRAADALLWNGEQPGPVTETDKSVLELAADIARMRKEGAFDGDNDDKWGQCDLNGDSWEARETDNTPKRPDCDD